MTALVDDAFGRLAEMDIMQLAQFANLGVEQQHIVSSHLLVRFHAGLVGFHLDSDRFRLMLAETESQGCNLASS